jgi:haloalkane dehalogenase
MTSSLPPPDRRSAAPELPAWLEAMVPFQRYCLELGGTRVHVMETGEGLPVVMLHGNPTWGFLYRKVARQLCDAPYRLILPDLVGLGLSDKPADAAAHTLERHIEWMAALYDALALERAVFVVQDWGGPIGVGALAARPSLRAGLVVLNTVLSPPRPGFRATWFHRFARMPLVSDAAFRLAGFPQRMLGLVQGDRASIRGDVARAYRHPLRSLRDNVAPLALARMVPDSFLHPSIAPLARCQDYVQRFGGPCAIVWGDRDPILGGVIGWMQKLLPRAPVTRTRAGHFLQEEVPHAIAAAVRAVAEQL